MALKLLNVSKKFDSKEILNSFSFEFGETGLYLIIGESGAGKTTLLRIISGLDKSYTGEVSGGGEKLCSMHFQEYRLFPQMSAIDNVCLVSFDKPTVDDYENARKLLGRLKISLFDMNQPPRMLSGGMKQRISLARAILKDSPILLLDEPTKELDYELVEIVKEIITEESKRRLVILVTHDTDIFSDLPKEIIKLQNMHS